MKKQLLITSALCAIGLSISVAHAAPAAGILETLKADARNASTLQQVHYDGRRHWRHHHHHCWWQDKWLCRWFW